MSKATGADDAAESTSIDIATLLASQLVAAPAMQTSSEVELAAPLDVLPLSTVHPQTSPACRVRVLKPETLKHSRPQSPFEEPNDPELQILIFKP